jgi:hypothetical protein
MAPLQVLRVLGECRHCSPLSIDSGLQRKDVPQLRSAVLAHIPEREIADIHAMDDKRTRDSEDARRIVRAEFLIFCKDCNPFALEQMPDSGFNQSRGFRGEADNLVLAGLPSDPNLDPIAFADLTKALRHLAVAVREFNEAEHLRGHDHPSTSTPR